LELTKKIFKKTTAKEYNYIIKRKLVFRMSKVQGRFGKTTKEKENERIFKKEEKCAQKT